MLKQVNQVITTIPGIGDTLGAIIISEIGAINRFDAPNKLVAFAGLDVKVTQSGEFTGTKQKISKRGSPYLRRAIWLAANRAAFCDPIRILPIFESKGETSLDRCWCGCPEDVQYHLYDTQREQAV